MAVDVIFVCDEVGNVDAEDQRKLEEIGKIKDDNNNSDKVNQTCAKEDQGHVEDILDDDHEMVTEFGDNGREKLNK